MRAFSQTWRIAALSLALTVLLAPSARADDPTVGSIQVRLVESRQHLNALYAQSAAAAERLHGATYAWEQAKAEVTETNDSLARAEADLDAQRRAVADLTVEQLASGSEASSLMSLFQSDGPQQVLERASAYSSAGEAMAARMDALDASTIVHQVAVGRARDAAAETKAAASRRDEAKREIDRAIAEAESTVESTEAERRTLLAQLARAESTTVTAVTRRQDVIDERLDEAPVAVAPRPSPPSSTSPPAAPSAPTPTTAAPAPAVPSTPPPTNPPQASSGTVEKAIGYAQAQLGEPYAWGGAGPSSWDCSGLTMRSFASGGVTLPRSAVGQYSQFAKVPLGSIRRGDLLFWSEGSAASIYHVAIYLGDGRMIHAPRPGRGVEIVSVGYWIKPDLASRPG